MQNKPTVSVVIPCYNAASYLHRTLESALNQTYPPKEVVVVDDGSTDNSCEIARSYGKSIKLVTQQRRGAHAARKAGVQTTSSKYVAFQDADDTVSNTRIEELVEALETDNDCVAAIGITANEHDGTRTPKGCFSSCDDGSISVILGTFDWMLQNGIPISGAMNLLARREQALAAFNDGAGLPAANDYDYQLSLALHGDFAFRKSINCFYRPGTHGITSCGQNALQPTMAICASVEKMRLSIDPESRRRVVRRLSENGPMFIWPLLVEGKIFEAAKLVRLLTIYGEWRRIPRRLWWGFSNYRRKSHQSRRLDNSEIDC